ncbi:MAG: hypothetical protein LBC68_03765 [Prevotellaceae bacterium]|nr:hypothetical protein [Prevotellaceae bacterium]
MVEIELRGQSRQALPEIQSLDGLKIQTVNAVECFGYQSKLYTQDYYRLFLNLVDRNGHEVLHEDIPLIHLSLWACKGINLAINKVLSIKDCYINNPEYITGVVILVIAYEIDGYSRQTDALPQATTLSIPVNYAYSFRNYFPDNRVIFGTKLQSLIAAESVISPLGEPCYHPDDETFRALYVTLVKGVYKIFDTVPLVYFHQISWYERIKFKNIVFDCNSSYIEVGRGLPEDEFIKKNVLFYIEYKK